MVTDLLGWAAALLVLFTFCCKQMVSLRLMALSSNLAFIGYGSLAHLWPILALHSVMVPLNMWRLCGALVDNRGCVVSGAKGRRLHRLLDARFSINPQ